MKELTQEQKRIMDFLQWLEEQGYIKLTPYTYYDWGVIISDYYGLSAPVSEQGIEEAEKIWNDAGCPVMTHGIISCIMTALTAHPKQHTEKSDI